MDNNAYTVLEQQAILMGSLMKAKGKVTTADYNKLSATLGLDTVNRSELRDARELVVGDNTAFSLYTQACRGTLTIDDLGFTKKAVGDSLSSYLVAHEEVLADSREFRKIQREGIHFERLVNGLKKYTSQELAKLEPYTPILDRVDPTDVKRSLIVCLSDWHVGALVFNKDTGGYSFAILEERLERLKREVLDAVDLYYVEQVTIFHVGDLIEHINMRNVNQAFDAEFPATEQIARAKRLLTQFLIDISGYVPVVFGLVGGNHDRFQGNKADKIYNDNIAYLVLDEIISMSEFGLLPNVQIIDNRDDVYSIMTNVGGKVVKVVHGDFEGKKDDHKIPKHIKEFPIDLLIMGHIHTFRVVQEDFARHQIYVGSPMGANDYSKEHGFPTTKPSQALIVLERNSDNLITHNVIL